MCKSHFLLRPCATLLAVLKVQSGGERLILGGSSENSWLLVCKTGAAPVNKAREQLPFSSYSIDIGELNNSLVGIIGQEDYFDIGIKPS